MKNPDHIENLTIILKEVNNLLKLLEKQKPGSVYSETEIRAFAAFPQIAVTSGSKALQVIQKEELLIPLLERANREDAIFFLKGLSQRISDVLKTFGE